MGEPRPELGVMAAPEELIDALHALGAIRAPSRAERAKIERQSASRELLRLECAHHLAGVVEMQVLMAAGAAADAIEEPAAEDSTRVLMAGWELFSGASADQDDARVGLLAAQVVEQMRSTAEILESMIPPEHRSTDKGAGGSTPIDPDSH